MRPVLEPSREPSAGAVADLIVGVPADPDRLAAAEAALALQAQLRAAFPGRAPAAVILSDDPHGAVPAGEPLPSPAPGEPPPVVHTVERLGTRTALPALLETALACDAPACALLEPLPRDGEVGWLKLLLDPILDGGFDLVFPAYRHRRLEGLLNTGVSRPLARALFGRRLRQPLGREVALSRRLAEHVLSDGEWQTGPSVGSDLLVSTQTLPGDSRIGESFLGPRPPSREPDPDVPTALARVLGTIFLGMEAHAHRWQRVRGSTPVAVFGDPCPLDAGPHHADVAPLVSAFALGWQDLRALWSVVLPPQTLLALQRIPRDRPEAFRVDDRLWARIVYDFGVAWRLKVMERTQLLRSMAPLYLGWAAGWATEVAPLDCASAEARAERLCEAFEAEKPYLISRWRWPDRFLP